MGLVRVTLGTEALPVKGTGHQRDETNTMKAMTTRRRFLANAGWAGMGILLFSFTTLGFAGPRPTPEGAKPNDSAPVMRQGWLLNQDDL